MTYYYSGELYHHGVKGMKWGVRRYQYKDGSLTPAGQRRNKVNNSKGAEKVVRLASMKMSELAKQAATSVTGKQYADTYLKQGTSFKRIQTSKEFENFAFYATYKKADSDKYMGLFGKNLTSRAAAEANRAEKAANASGSEADLKTAKEARDKASNMKVYQLSIQATKKLKVPSDENASHITANLLKDSEFKNNVIESIKDSKEKMRRPTQQLLFNQAQNALKKEPDKMTNTEKVAVYKALNLSLTNHNSYEVAAQNAFYSELKKKGYNALLDYNDKEYSSYHAKRPMIVFDLDSVKLQSVAETNPKVVNKLYTKYNAERLSKEAVANTVGLLSRMGTRTVADCQSYMNTKIDSYLSA